MVTIREQFVAGDHRKSTTSVAKSCCNGSYSLAYSNGRVDVEANSKVANAKGDCKISPAHESCQTSLGMAEMQVVTSLAQFAYCEADIAPRLRGRGAPLVYISSESTSSSERSAPTSSSPAPTAKGGPLCPSVGFGIRTSRPGNVQPSPPKVPSKAKWNSNVKCHWPPCSPSSPTRVPGGATTVFTSRGLVATPETKTRSVGVMTYSAINADELSKKVESLEMELGVHVGNERQLLSVNEQLRKRLEKCLRELNDAGMINIHVDNLNDEMDRILQLLRHLSERNAALEKEKTQVQAKLQREAALNKMQASKILMQRQIEDHDVDLRNAECQTVCFCQQVDTRKRRRERKRWSKEEELPISDQCQSRPNSPMTAKES